MFSPAYSLRKTASYNLLCINVSEDTAKSGPDPKNLSWSAPGTHRKTAGLNIGAAPFLKMSQCSYKKIFLSV
jgi:hypothetical protein